MRIRTITLGMTLAALVLCATALALTPKTGLWTIGTGEGGGSWTVSGHKILKGATSVSDLKCNRYNAVIPKAITIAADGSFSYSGPLKGQAGTIVFKGRFSSASKVSGSSKITKGSCSHKVSWTGKPLAQQSGQVQNGPPAMPAPMVPGT